MAYGVIDDAARFKQRVAPFAPRGRRSKVRRIALIGDFPPRRCGIATFTADIHASLAAAAEDLKIDVVALTDPGGIYAYGEEVTDSLPQDDLDAYSAVGRRLNERGVDLICVQHEFGIFGGPAGRNLLALLSAARAPVVTTFHTILERPSDDQRRVVDALLKRSSHVIAMAERGRDILTKVFGANPQNIVVIPHGAPDRPFTSSRAGKARLGWAQREVLMTFGLLSAGKGLESVIRALPEIVERRPNALYVVVGATHPHVLRAQGEAYRESLQELARTLSVEAHLQFVNAYLDDDELLEHLAASDVYVTPYLNEAQITSGTLSYAVALGKPVVSTPYWHARELLADGAGLLVDFNDVEGFARAIGDVLSDEQLRGGISARAYKVGRSTIWSRSAESYLKVFEEVVSAPRRAAAGAKAVDALAREPSLAPIRRMTDDCGILQHASFCVPDRRHGYCIDDNARALILIQKLRKRGRTTAELDRLELIFAAFVEHAWNGAAGRFRNFMSYERSWLEDFGSDDSNGRALWSLGEVAAGCADRELRGWALALAKRAAPHLAGMRSPRARAFCVLGADRLLEAAPNDGVFLQLLKQASGEVAEALAGNRRAEWVWPEAALGYDNARLAQALLVAAGRLNDASLRSAGLEMLSWLTELQTAPFGHFRPVGNETFGCEFARPSAFDQQPLEAAATVDACWAAFDLTQDATWAQRARTAYMWFFGANDLFARMEAEPHGGCFDGLGRDGVNRNQGAESILSIQLAHCDMLLHQGDAAISRTDA